MHIQPGARSLEGRLAKLHEEYIYHYIGIRRDIVALENGFGRLFETT
jgi:hypothetical protein